MQEYDGGSAPNFFLRIFPYLLLSPSLIRLVACSPGAHAGVHETSTKPPPQDSVVHSVATKE